MKAVKGIFFIIIFPVGLLMTHRKSRVQGYELDCVLQFYSLKSIMHNLTITQPIHRKHLGGYDAVYPLTMLEMQYLLQQSE